MYIHYFTIFSKILYLYLGNMKADRPMSANLSNIEESKHWLGYQLCKIG